MLTSDQTKQTPSVYDCCVSTPQKNMCASRSKREKKEKKDAFVNSAQMDGAPCTRAPRYIHPCAKEANVLFVHHPLASKPTGWREGFRASVNLTMTEPTEMAATKQSTGTTCESTPCC